jgi:hypothetical protein
MVMVIRIIFIILFSSIYASEINTKSKNDDFENHTIDCIKKVKKYIAKHKKYIKLNTEFPAEFIIITRNPKTEKVQKINIIFLTTNKCISFFFNKTETITKIEILDIHPYISESPAEYDFAKISSWDKIFEVYFKESIKYLNKNAIPFNYRNNEIYFSLDEDVKRNKRNKRQIRYDMWFIDKTKMTKIILKFDSNFKTKKYKIEKYEEMPDDEYTID